MATMKRKTPHLLIYTGEIMFKNEIFVDKKGDIRFGYTEVSYNQTFQEIMDILDEHECEEVITRRKKGKTQIGFVYQDDPYLITVPKVYIRDTLNKDVGIRIVKYYLEIVLDWEKERPIDFDIAMLPFRVVEYKGGRYTLGDMVNELPSSDGLLGEMVSSAEELPESDEEPKDVGYRVVED